MAAPPPQSPSPATAHSCCAIAGKPVFSALFLPMPFLSRIFRKEPASASVHTAIAVPSHSRWFSFGEIHATERRILPEFFDGKSPSKNPSLYMYYRDFIVRRFRENPARKISFTEVRRSLVGDVGSGARVFDFLETWGLINYTGSEKQGQRVAWRIRRRGGRMREQATGWGAVKSFCTTCKSECNIVCFATEKVPDLILCARCFVRGSFRGGLTHADFKRVDVSSSSEEKKRDWTDKDSCHLLEKVAEHVGGGKSERDCVMRFIRLPFAEQFVEPLRWNVVQSSALKQMRLSPLADASNPIMSQVAFLATIAGSEIAEAASKAAIAALDEVNGDGSLLEDVRDSGAIDGDADDDHKMSKGQEAAVIGEARALLEKEQHNIEESSLGLWRFRFHNSSLSERHESSNHRFPLMALALAMQMKEMLEKIIHFEELELLMEREWLQLQHLKTLLFVDQLNFLQQRSRPKSKMVGRRWF
ncbi:unnamed protein product [Spirodela intermedia]|uniref:SWIRM domain-containing protein n=1 Tax=Spirodela intermedia TaxID=51605 RepID=A0A7I8JK12_SPIIN|nr:unnamed protein product [Spirodela intermedia]CAA6670201.1 unnamed protein product [Spirodela intermedia]